MTDKMSRTMWEIPPITYSPNNRLHRRLSPEGCLFVLGLFICVRVVYLCLIAILAGTSCENIPMTVFSFTLEVGEGSGLRWIPCSDVVYGHP